MTDGRSPGVTDAPPEATPPSWLERHRPVVVLLLVALVLFTARIGDLSLPSLEAIREMDDFKDKNPGKSLFMDSQASSWLGKLRDFSEKLAKTKGDVRRGAANDANWIVNNYNTMITLSETAVRFPR